MSLALQSAKSFGRSTYDTALPVAPSYVGHWLVLTYWLKNSLTTELRFRSLYPLTIQVTWQTNGALCLVALMANTAVIRSLSKGRVSIDALLLVDLFNWGLTLDLVCWLLLFQQAFRWLFDWISLHLLIFYRIDNLTLLLLFRTPDLLLAFLVFVIVRWLVLEGYWLFNLNLDCTLRASRCVLVILMFCPKRFKGLIIKYLEIGGFGLKIKCDLWPVSLL